jgi:hypothetical protein
MRIYRLEKRYLKKEKRQDVFKTTKPIFKVQKNHNRKNNEIHDQEDKLSKEQNSSQLQTKANEAQRKNAKEKHKMAKEENRENISKKYLLEFNKNLCFLYQSVSVVEFESFNLTKTLKKLDNSIDVLKLMKACK